MSATTIGGDLVHYEVLGRGRPVILVHGWLGSWHYWVPLMQQLHVKYRVYALDLFGFGDTAKNEKKYDLDNQVNLIAEFLKQMGLPKAAFVGHGLGAMVLTHFAQQHPEHVARMCLISAPLFDPGNLSTRTPPGQKVYLQAPDPNEIAKILTTTELEEATLPKTPASDTTSAGETVKEEATSSDTTSDTTASSEGSTTPTTEETVKLDGVTPANQTLDGAPTLVMSPIETPVVGKESAQSPNTAEAKTESTTETPTTETPTETQSADGHEVPLESKPAPSYERPTVKRLTPEQRENFMERVKQTGEIEKIVAPITTPDPTPTVENNGLNPLKSIFDSNTLDNLLEKCFKKSDATYDKLKVTIDKTDAKVLTISSQSYSAGDNLDALRAATSPVVVVHGTDDPIIPRPPESIWDYLTLQKDELLVPIPLSGVGHFPMLGHDPFFQLVNDFLEIANIYNLEVKERWRRRSR